jgi:16S rRNA (uracil1498-N3)-methyltransferase
MRMPRFFVPGTIADAVSLIGEDAAHVARSLRMTPGETLTLCDGAGTDYLCVITSVAPDEIQLRVERSEPSRSEPDVAVTLFQGLPKGEKMEWIIQKAVELGAARIVPYLAARSISRPDSAAAKKKAQRWQKIADEAAKQSQRGSLPQVDAPVSFEQAVREAFGCGQVLLLYEGGGRPLRELLPEKLRNLALFVGPEGGFDPDEVATLQSLGAGVVTLGNRILRTETAPLAALAAVMYATGNLE